MEPFLPGIADDFDGYLRVMSQPGVWGGEATRLHYDPIGPLVIMYDTGLTTRQALLVLDSGSGVRLRSKSDLSYVLKGAATSRGQLCCTWSLQPTVLYVLGAGLQESLSC
jgi:hypothetical protein